MLRVRELIARLCVDKEGCYQLQSFCASVTSALNLSAPTQLRTNQDALKELYASDPDDIIAFHDDGHVNLQMPYIIILFVWKKYDALRLYRKKEVSFKFI